MLIKALIILYETTLDDKWLNTSKELMEYTVSPFFDAQSEMFFFTSKDDSDLIAKKIELIDQVIPLSNSVLTNCLFKLGHYYSDKKYSEMAEQMLKNISLEDMQESPYGYSNWLSLMSNYTKPYYEVAVSGL